VPVTVLLEVTCKPDRADDAVDVLRAALPDTRAFAGCLGVELLRDQDDAAKLLLVERWESRDHQKAYLRWRAGDGATVGLPETLAAPPSTRYLDDTGA
jgi:quinol monooxygenase YgiN